MQGALAYPGFFAAAVDLFFEPTGRPGFFFAAPSLEPGFGPGLEPTSEAGFGAGAAFGLKESRFGLPAFLGILPSCTQRHISR